MHIEFHSLWPRRPLDGSLPLGWTCDTEGLLLAGNCRLVTAAITADGQKFYRVRRFDELNAILSMGYGGAIDAARTYPKLERIAEQMSQGNWTHATLGALYLRLPDLPDQTAARRVLAADWLLKAFWDPQLHPRWPAHAAEGRGGEFSAAGDDDDLLVPIGAMDDRYMRDRLGRSIIVQIDPFLKPGQPPAVMGAFPPSISAGVAAQVAAAMESQGIRAAARLLVEQVPHLLDELPTLWPYLRVYIKGPYSISELRASPDFASFSSADSFKDKFGSAGEGWEWEHLVGQTDDNINRFGEEQIHNTDNVIRLPKLWHEKISNYYSSKPKEYGGLTVREVVGKLSYDEQRAFKLDLLKKWGVIQ